MSTNSPAQQAMPDPSLTPGAIDPYITERTICEPGHAATARHVTMLTKLHVFLRYHRMPSRAYVIDHLVPLEIGGTNDVTNLWPQPIHLAAAKDIVENDTHKQICQGKLSLAAGQAIFLHWGGVWP